MSDLAEGERVRLCEAEGGAAVVAESLAGHLCCVGGEAVVVADVAPEAPLKNFKAAVIVAGAGTAIHQSCHAIHLCTPSQNTPSLVCLWLISPSVTPMLRE